MPASTRGVKRDKLTFVLINDGFAYGWNAPDLAAAAGVSSADLGTGLGHMTAAEAAAISNVVMVTGANAPKPMRVTKKFPNAAAGQRASLTTFAAYNKLATANAIGFQLSKRPRSISISAPKAGARTFTGVVELSNGLQYAQPVDAAAATPERRATLGIQVAAEISDTEAKKLARGCRTKPGRAEVSLGDGVAARLPFSTTKEDDVRAAEGITVIETEYVEYAAGAAPAGGT